jgi:hypothetical protein
VLMFLRMFASLAETGVAPRCDRHNIRSLVLASTTMAIDEVGRAKTMLFMHPTKSHEASVRAEAQLVDLSRQY